IARSLLSRTQQTFCRGCDLMAPASPRAKAVVKRPMSNTQLPLNGIRILDLTMVWAGPSGTRLLADMGAEVIKVESARSWDMLRSLHFLGGPTERWWNKSAYFNHNNRNKYACTLDLQTDRGRELALRLAAQS